MTPRVSVLMSVLDGAPRVRDAMASVLAQSLADLELVVVDDGSTDGTPAILAEFAAKDPRVRVVRNGANLGLTRSLNRGLAECRAPIVARLDADDVAFPERLARQVEFLDANPGVAILGTAFEVANEAGEVLHVVAPPPDDASIRARLLVGNCFCHSSVAFRREAIAKLGDYDERFALAQDYDLWVRAAAADPPLRFASLAEPLVARLHGVGLSESKAEAQREAAFEISMRAVRAAIGEEAFAAPEAREAWRRFRVALLEDGVVLAGEDVAAVAPAIRALFATPEGEAIWGPRLERLARRCLREGARAAGFALRSALAEVPDAGISLKDALLLAARPRLVFDASTHGISSNAGVPRMNDIAVVIAHFAPEPKYRDVLIETIRSIRAQRFGGRIEIAVSDDGSCWSKGLVPEGAAYREFGPDEIAAEPLLADLGVDRYVAGPDSPRYCKAILWNRAVALTSAEDIVFLDDDHAFTRGDALARYSNHLKRYRFVVGRIRNPDGRFRLYRDRYVQGANFAMKRSLLAEVGGFGEYTADWGAGEDSDIFWKVYAKLAAGQAAGERRAACWAGEIVTVDRCSRRWAGCSGGFEASVKGFMEKHGVPMHDNASRDKRLWVDHASPFPYFAELPFILANRRVRKVGATSTPAPAAPPPPTTPSDPDLDLPDREGENA